MEKVRIGTYDSTIEAYQAKNVLENEGIICYLQDEHTVGMNPLYSNAIGGVKLLVAKESESKASAILDDLNQKSYTDENDNIISCPKCESTKLIAGAASFKTPGGIVSIIISFLLMIFPFHWNSVYQCKNCNHQFK